MTAVLTETGSATTSARLVRREYVGGEKAVEMVAEVLPLHVISLLATALRNGCPGFEATGSADLIEKRTNPPAFQTVFRIRRGHIIKAEAHESSRDYSGIM